MNNSFVYLFSIAIFLSWSLNVIAANDFFLAGPSEFETSDNSNTNKIYLPKNTAYPSDQLNEPLEKMKKNSLPNAVDDFGYSVNEGSSLSGIKAKLNDFDPDGDEIIMVSATSENAEVKINPDGSLNYYPKIGFQGSDRIFYKISDGKGGFAEGRVHIDVKPIPLSSSLDKTKSNKSATELNDVQHNSKKNNESEIKNQDDFSFFGVPFRNPFSSENINTSKTKDKELIKKTKDLYKETVKEIKEEMKNFGCNFVYQKYIIEKKVPRSYPSNHNWNNWSSFDIKQYEDLILGCK